MSAAAASETRWGGKSLLCPNKVKTKGYTHPSSCAHSCISILETWTNFGCSQLLGKSHPLMLLPMQFQPWTLAKGHEWWESCHADWGHLRNGPRDLGRIAVKGFLYYAFSSFFCCWGPRGDGLPYTATRLDPVSPAGLGASAIKKVQSLKSQGRPFLMTTMYLRKPAFNFIRTKPAFSEWPEITLRRLQLSSRVRRSPRKYVAW